MTQDALGTALALAKLGIASFPWRLTADGGKVPYKDTRGHLDASTDPETLATLFAQYPDARVGVHVGASGLVVADLDRKGSKNGFESSEGWLEFPETFAQQTPNGGVHYIYAAPEGVHLAPSTDFSGFEGLDVRGGSSWIGWYSDAVPASRDAFAPAPEWLCEPAKSHVGSAFEGGLDDWLNSLPDSDEQPDDRVLDAITRIPDYDFGHTEMVEKVWEMVRLGSEGRMGVRHALELLRDEWLRGDYDTPDNRYSFDKAVDGAIKKAGALDERIAAFPALLSLLDAAPREVVDLATTSDPSKPKPEAHWFRLVKTALRNGFEPEDALALVWQAATTKALSRSWGIEFCADRVDDVAAEVESERREAAKVDKRQAAGLDTVESKPGDSIALLTNEEREYLAQRPTFIKRYLDTAADRFPMMNENYHRANAWTILSLALGPCGFYPVQGKTFGPNLYQITLGDSSTGKSDSIIMRQEILRLLFKDDGGFEFSSETSPEILQEELLRRSGDPTFFHQDEASGFFRRMNDRNAGWGAGTADKLTEYYGGYVPPVHKRTSSDDVKRGTSCFLTLHFFATPDRFYSQLTSEQFLSGFLARFQWSIGAPAVLTEDRYMHVQPDHSEVKEVPQSSIDIAEELDDIRSRLGLRTPAKGDERVWKRLAENAKAMEAILKSGSHWKITEPAFTRMVDALLKCVALLAFSRGTGRIEMVDVYGTIEQAEIWLAGLIEAASNVSASEFEREAREIALYVKQHANPWISEARLSTRFSRYNGKDWRDRLEWGLRTGLLVFDPANREHKDRYGWKGGDEDD